jgi:hypothetical protein
MGRPARRQLVRAHHAVNRDIAADTHHITAAAILDGEVLVGDAAGERQRVHAAEPDLEFRHARRRALSHILKAHASALLFAARAGTA